MTDLRVTLGGFVFEDFEVPEALPFGGRQQLSIKNLVGGRKVIDSMGADDEPIEWSGRFRGPDAQRRALAVDALRTAGRAVALTWGQFAFTVVIQRFRPVFERAFEIPYAITCEVVGTAPVQQAPGVDQMMSQDNATAQALGSTIGDPPLTSLLGTLDSAIGSVSRFAMASRATLAAVIEPINDVRTRTSLLIASAENTISSVATLGGVAPNNPLSRVAARLTEQVNAAVQQGNLYELNRVAGRMAGNLAAIGAGGAEYVTAGGSLFGIAAREYGDATIWTAIAAANGLIDPVVEGVQTLLIPPTPINTGGVPQF